MKRILFLIIISAAINVFGQQKKTENPISYRSVVYDDDNMYAVDSKGLLSVWNLKTLQKIHTAKDTIHHFITLAKDKKKSIFLGTDKGEVFRLRKTDYVYLPHFNLFNDSEEIKYIFFNAKNELYLILNTGVFVVKTKKVYDEFKNRPNGISVQKPDKWGKFKLTDIYFMPPGIAFMDKENRIWMAATMGEFSGSPYVFDTNRDEILSSPDVHCVQSFSGDNAGNVYITTGLQHFLNFGSINEVFPGTLESVCIYNSEQTFDGQTQNNKDRLFIGPGCFNNRDGRFYFSSSDGFYSAIVSGENKLTDIVKVFNQELTYLNESLAAGVQMAVKEMFFLPDNRLFFRTAANGIGVYDGMSVVVMLE